MSGFGMYVKNNPLHMCIPAWYSYEKKILCNNKVLLFLLSFTVLAFTPACQNQLRGHWHSIGKVLQKHHKEFLEMKTKVGK